MIRLRLARLRRRIVQVTPNSWEADGAPFDVTYALECGHKVQVWWPRDRRLVDAAVVGVELPCEICTARVRHKPAPRRVRKNWAPGGIVCVQASTVLRALTDKEHRCRSAPPRLDGSRSTGTR